MRVIGFRVRKDHFRYAVLELDAGGNVLWLNRTDEHKWTVPRAATTKSKALIEVHREVTRVIAKYSPSEIVIKAADAMRGMKPSPERVALEAVIMLAAEQLHVGSSERKYTNLTSKAEPINSGTVRTYAQRFVQPLDNGWDDEIADAIAVAVKALGK